METNDHVRNGLKNFSLRTSLHGFSEVYEAKTAFWRITWIIIVTVALAITTFLVSQSAARFISEPTNTVILPAKEDQILYPPLRICYNHWAFWVDFEMAIDKLKVTKEVLRYGLSYINIVYTRNPLDVDELETKFEQMMLSNNFTTLPQFYRAIAREVPLTGENNITFYFEKNEIIYRDPGFMYCYTITSKNVNKYFANNRHLFIRGENDKLISFMTFDETYENVKDYVSKEEYNWYMLRWIRMKSMYDIRSGNQDKSFTNFAPPLVLYPNAFDKQHVDIYTENDVYNVNFYASATTLKNTRSASCVEGYQSFASNYTCNVKCKAFYVNATCTCLPVDLSFILSNSTDTVCRKGIFYSTKNGTVDEYRAYKTYGAQVCGDDERFHLMYEKCLDACPRPCTTWNYDFTVSTTRMSTIVRQLGNKSHTNVSIKYPFGNKILVMNEVDSLTWENFVGTVGGLLGIWTGASVVSFLQLIYLCCCAENGDCCCCFSFPKREINNCQLKSVSRFRETVVINNSLHKN